MITENGPSRSAEIHSSDNSNISSDANNNNDNVNINNTVSDTRKEPVQSMGLEACTGRDGHSPLHHGELNAGTKNRAVAYHGKSNDGSLDVCIRVEKDHGDKEGHTEMYGMWIPLLEYGKRNAEVTSMVSCEERPR